MLKFVYKNPPWALNLKMLKFVYKKNKKKIKSITLYAVVYSHEIVIRNILYRANLRLKLSHRLELSKSCVFFYVFTGSPFPLVCDGPAFGLLLAVPTSIVFRYVFFQSAQ